MGPRGTLGCLVAAATLLSGAGPASAAEQTRDGYRAEAEPICKVNVEANDRILQGVRAEIRSGKLKQAGARFAKAAAALREAHDQLQALPKPPHDSSRLSRWLGYIQTEVQLLEQVARDLENGKKAAASRLAVRLSSTIARANSEVLEFEFDYCHVKPSQFI